MELWYYIVYIYISIYIYIDLYLFIHSRLTPPFLGPPPPMSETAAPAASSTLRGRKARTGRHRGYG